MVPEGLGDLEEDAFRSGVGFVWIRGGDLEFADDTSFWFLLAVADVKLAVFLVFRVKGESDQSFLKLVLLHLPVGEIEEGFGFLAGLIGGQQTDLAPLLDEELAPGAIGGGEQRC